MNRAPGFSRQEYPHKTEGDSVILMALVKGSIRSILTNSRILRSRVGGWEGFRILVVWWLKVE